jgi:uncharacterized repeat protein (TIGR01451 family)
MTSRKSTLIVLSIFLLGFSVFFPVLNLEAASSGNIHGTILDELGQPIEDVKVTAVSSTGSLEETKYTNDEGYFRMNLAGTYTMVFEKLGYVSQEISVRVTIAPTTNPENDAVKMGDIVLKKTLQLSANVLDRYTSPGNTLQLSFNIQNLGEESESIELLVSSPDKWNTRILDDIGEIESIFLSTGIKTYILEVEVPSTANETGIVTITAIGSSTTEIDFSIKPKTSNQEIELKSTYLSISEELGQEILLPLIISNIGEIDKIITLKGVYPNDWELIFKTTSDMVIKTLLLAAGQTETLTLEINPSESSPIGDYTIMVEAEDENEQISDSIEFEVNIREAISELEIVSSFSKVTIEAGETVNFPLAIWNKGEKDTLALLNVPVIPENWNSAFVSEDIEVSSLILTGGESEALKLEITPPNAVESGEYTLVVIIESDDGTQRVMELEITVEGSYELELELSTLYTTVTIGNEVSYTGRVINRGQTPITTLYLEAVLPDEWSVSISPAQVQSLEPRDSVTFTIRAETPADTVAGDYLLTMQAISDQLESDQIDLRVTAQASTSWGLIGLGIALLAIIGAVYVFRKFKRR